MSRIYFHSEGGDAEVRGSERHHMGGFCNDLMHAALGTAGDFECPRWLLPFLPARVRGYALRDIRNHLSFQGVFHLADGTEDAFTVALNTALVAGGDAVKLMARLHGQCEIHCWVDGPDREWLARIMRQGREQHILRADQGWEGVMAFLLNDASKPVVCSYSVTDQFPNFDFLPDDHPLKLREDEERWDDYYDIPDPERWALCMPTLRANQPLLQMKPGNWQTYLFGRRLSAFSLQDAKPAVSAEADHDRN